MNSLSDVRATILLYPPIRLVFSGGPNIKKADITAFLSVRVIDVDPKEESTLKC